MRPSSTLTFTGLLPGVGKDVGAWSFCALAKRFSREPERFHGWHVGCDLAVLGLPFGEAAV